MTPEIHCFSAAIENFNRLLMPNIYLFIIHHIPRINKPQIYYVFTRYEKNNGWAGWLPLLPSTRVCNGKLRTMVLTHVRARDSDTACAPHRSFPVPLAITRPRHCPDSLSTDSNSSRLESRFDHAQPARAVQTSARSSRSCRHFAVSFNASADKLTSGTRRALSRFA